MDTSLRGKYDSFGWLDNRKVGNPIKITKKKDQDDLPIFVLANEINDGVDRIFHILSYFSMLSLLGEVWISLLICELQGFLELSNFIPML